MTNDTINFLLVISVHNQPESSGELCPSNTNYLYLSTTFVYLFCNECVGQRGLETPSLSCKDKI